MAKDRSLVRASDIASWTYCHRAWWLAHVQQAENENPQALRRGDRAHQRHGAGLVRSSQLQRLGLILVLAGLALAILALLLWLGPF